jgi:hypothetical protein
MAAFSAKLIQEGEADRTDLGCEGREVHHAGKEYRQVDIDPEPIAANRKNIMKRREFSDASNPGPLRRASTRQDGMLRPRSALVSRPVL